MSLSRVLARFAEDKRAGIAIVGALMMTATIATTALAVDTAAIYLERRKAQTATDIAALSAAQNLTGAAGAATASLADNGFPQGPAEVTLGRYVADPTLAAAARFEPGATPANAARVRLRSTAPLFFGRALVRSDHVATETEAIAVNTRLASFSIGSRLASLDGGLANALLGGLTGGEVSLSVMDYEALLAAELDMFDLFDQLSLDLEAATYDDLLNLEMPLGDLLAAASDVLDQGAGDQEAARALDRLAEGSDAAKVVTLGDLVDLGPYANASAADAALTATVSAFDLISATAQAANGTHMVEIDAGLGLPGLLSVTAKLAIGERPQGTSWIAVGQEGTSVHTAQTRLLLRAKLGGSGLLPSLDVPLYLEIASGTATLSAIECGWNARADTSVTVDARPGIAHLWLAEIDEARLPEFGSDVQSRHATLARVLAVAVKGRAHVEAGNLDATPVTFSLAEIEAGTVKTVHTHDYLSSLTASLLGTLDIKVEPLGLGLPGLLAPLARTILAGATAPLDRALETVLLTLGLRLGEVDIRVGGVRCDGAALVS